MNRFIPLIAACVFATACSPQAEPKAGEPARPMTTADAGMANHQMDASMSMMEPAEGDTASTREYKAATMTMMTAMPAYTGNADVDFMKQMRVHHQAAIAMARVELAQGTNAEAKTLAQEIVAAQGREIATIDRWLTANGG